MARDPLTYRHPRTLAEIEPDPRAWWTNGAAEVEHEHAIRLQLAEDARRHPAADEPVPFTATGAYVLLAVVAAVSFLVIVALRP